jgi:hypothetical protein
VIKQSKIRKKTVDLQHAPARPSRIRRDPVRVQEEQLARNAWWASREWEIRLAVAGIIVFALGISALVIDIGELLSH